MTSSAHAKHAFSSRNTLTLQSALAAPVKDTALQVLQSVSFIQSLSWLGIGSLYRLPNSSSKLPNCSTGNPASNVEERLVQLLIDLRELHLEATPTAAAAGGGVRKYLADHATPPLCRQVCVVRRGCQAYRPGGPLKGVAEIVCKALQIIHSQIVLVYEHVVQGGAACALDSSWLDETA